MFDVLISLFIACVVWWSPVQPHEDQPGWDCMTMGNHVCGVSWDVLDGDVVEAG